MENKNNDKVPMAILSCFLIAFILQGILKISGVFVFEKALNWEIFKIIDNNKFLFMTYHTILNIITVYCLSFALTSKPYSKKWYHYIIICLGTTAITLFRMNIKTPMYCEFIYDLLMYITIPIIVNFTTFEKYKNFCKNNITTSVSIIAVQIMLYCCYLGLCYWSGLLNSLLPVMQSVLYTSTHFLVFFEMYIGLILTMLSLNHFVRILNKGG